MGINNDLNKLNKFALERKSFASTLTCYSALQRYIKVVGR